MKATNALALVSALLLATVWSAPRVVAKTANRSLIVAQAEKEKQDDAKAQKPKKAQPKKPAAAQAKPKPQAHPKASQAKPKPQAKPQAQAQEQHKPEAAKQKREERRDQREERRSQRREQKQEQKNEERQKPTAAPPKEERQKPAAAQKTEKQQKPAAAQQKQEQQRPTAAQKKEEQKKPEAAQKEPQKPAATQQKEEPQKPAAAQPQKQEQQKPAAVQPKEEQRKPAAAQKQEERKPEQKPAAQQKREQQQPAAQHRNAPANSEAAAQEAIKPKSADEFILRKGEQRQRGITDVRRERRETREGNRIVIHEGDRRIVKEDNRVIIRHREAERFAIGARDVNVRRRGDEITTIVERPNGVRIINVTDEDGHLIRRVRRDHSGREVVIIDDRNRGRRPDIFIDVPPPRFHGHRDRYIVEAWRVPPPRLYEVFTAPPIEPIERRYTLAQVRYNEPLRAYMPRVDLEINFESGSWQITPDQAAELAEIAKALNRAIDRNPDEVYLIEGYTDAVGSEEDNLSLSDRRAEAVAVALTQEFNVPPENLVTQGYGEQYLKVETEGASRANRRVSIRRITPLLDKVAGR